ncbi:MAG: hypothetical protein ACLR8Y_08840 [Alistipes indistinctus]
MWEAIHKHLAADRAGSGGKAATVAARHAEQRALAHSFEVRHFHMIRPVRLVHVVVFDKQKNGEPWRRAAAAGRMPSGSKAGTWNAATAARMDQIHAHADLARPARHGTTGFFMGTAVYRKRFDADELRGTVLNLGEVAGVSDVPQRQGAGSTVVRTAPVRPIEGPWNRVKTNSKCA